MEIEWGDSHISRNECEGWRYGFKYIVIQYIILCGVCLTPHRQWNAFYEKLICQEYLQYYISSSIFTHHVV